MPAIRQTRELLSDRELDPSQVNVHKLDDIPALWVDKNLLMQVAFNLISNAIKYSGDSAVAFRIEIAGHVTDSSYAIAFRDWGRGVPQEMRDVIFDEGVRGIDASGQHVSGDGLGLWVARQAVEAHGGELPLTHLAQPTEFTIFLPKRLSNRPTGPLHTGAK